MKKIISIAISEELADSLNQTSKALGMSRSEYIEMMIKKGFHFSDEITDDISEITSLQNKAKLKMTMKEDTNAT